MFRRSIHMYVHVFKKQIYPSGPPAYAVGMPTLGTRDRIRIRLKFEIWHTNVTLHSEFTCAAVLVLDFTCKAVLVLEFTCTAVYLYSKYFAAEILCQIPSFDASINHTN